MLISQQLYYYILLIELNQYADLTYLLSQANLELVFLCASLPILQKQVISPIINKIPASKKHP